MAYARMTHTDRLHIEKMYNRGHTYREISRALGFAPSSIYAEIKRGLYDHLDSDTWQYKRRYSSDIAQQKADASATAKGPPLKLGHRYDYAALVASLIKSGWSPDAITGRLRCENQWTVCTTTLYTYIARGYIPGITNSNLAEKGKRKKRAYRKVKSHKRPPAGQSIEHRPAHVNDRQTFGHWEMDTVIGKSSGKGQALLVMTERKTRAEIISHLPDKTAQSVVTALDRIFKAYPKGTFQTITVDNGMEFSNCYYMEHTNQGDKRTALYYCHPYSSFERGSNENANKLIRRFFPKGQSLAKATPKQVKQAQNFMNHLPRKILNYATPAEVMKTHLQALQKNLTKCSVRY